ncbi:MAG: hypothetical protein ACI4OJ_05550 [Lachnospiraceae bacterium]
MTQKNWISIRFRVIYVHAKGKQHPTEDKDMMKYRFIKDGKTYTTTQGRNRFEAQLNLELQFQTDLKGATFEEIWKGKVDRTGIVK